MNDLVRIESGLPLNDFVPSDACLPFTRSFEHHNEFLNQATWFSGAGDTAQGAQVTFSYDGSGTFSPSFIGTSLHGCTDTTLFPNLIQVSPGTIVFNGPFSQTYCSPKTVLFNATLLGDGPYFWDFGDGTSSSDSIVSHLFDSAGTFLVSLQLSTYQGCDIALDSHSVIRISSLSADFSHQVTWCTGRQVTFTPESEFASSYLWHLGGFTTNIASPSYTFPGNGPYHVSLNVSDTLGCEASVTKVNLLDFTNCAMGGSGFGNAGSGGAGLPSGTPQAPLFEGCAPFPFSITSPYDSLVAIVWYFGDGDTSHAVNPSHTYTHSGTYDLTVVRTHQGLSTDTLVFAYFARIGKPIASFDLDEITTCVGSSIALTNTSSNAQHYLTRFGDGDSSLAEHPIHVYDSAGYFNVALTAMDTLGCSNTTYQVVQANFPNPALDLPPVICAGDSVQIGHNINHFASYVWHIGDSTIAAKHPVLMGLDTGLYSVFLQGFDSTGCAWNLFEGSSFEVRDPIAHYSFPNGNVVCESFEGLLINESSGADQYTWWINDSLFSVNANPYLSLQTTGDYVIKLRARHGGCYQWFADTLIITQATADFNYSISSACLPAVVSFADASIGAVSWHWQFSNGDTSSAVNPAFNATSYASAPIQLTIIDSNGCTATSTQSAIPFHQVGFVPTGTTGCIPLVVSMSDTSSNSTGYSWTFNNGASGSSATPFTQFNAPGFYTVTITAQHSSGCSTVLVYDSLFHVAKPTSNFSFDYATNNCAPLLVQFEDASEGALSYQWDFDDGFTSTGLNPQHFYLQPDTYSASLIVTGLYGCTDTFVHPDLIIVAGPVADFNLSSTSVCLGDTLHLENLTTGATQYDWLFGDGTLSADFEPAHVYQAPGVYDIVLNVVDAGLCYDLKVWPGFRVKERPIPAPSIKAHGECIPLALDLKDMSTYAVDPTLYWHVGSSQFITHTDTTVYITESGRHNVWVRVRNANGCSRDSVLNQRVTAYDTIDQTDVLLANLSVNDKQAELAYHLDTMPNFLGHTLFQYSATLNDWVKLREGNEVDFTYASTLTDASQSPACFVLQETHRCVQTPQPASIKPHCSIHLSINQTPEARNLQWTHLTNATKAAYRVMRRMEGESSFEMVGEVSGEQLKFSDVSGVCPEVAYYRIDAINVSGLGSNALGNVRRVKVDTLPALRQPVHITKASVIDNQHVLIEWTAGNLPQDLIARIDLYKMLGGRPTIRYELDPFQREFIDYEIDVQQEFGTYHVDFINTCGILPVRGNDGTSLLLEYDQNSYEVLLKWNPYSDYKEGLKEYQIQRLNENGEWEVIQRVEPEETEVKISIED